MLTGNWRKSSHSNQENCVEVALQDDMALVRDSELGEDSPVLQFTPGEWQAFLGGEFDHLGR